MLVMLSFPDRSLAIVPDYFGGIQNEVEYEEYVFLSGSPVKFTGKVSFSERESRGKVTTKYNFNLTHPTGSKLTRNVTYETTLDERGEKGQTIAKTTVQNYSEKVQIGTVKYTLEDYQLSASTIIDNRPASDYSSGTLVGRKIYKLDANPRSKVTVHLSGGNVGYKNFWGNTETQIIDYEITTDTWHGTVRSKVSDSQTKVLQYEKNDPTLASFAGGHARVTNQEMMGQYVYNFSTGSKGSVDLNTRYVPKVQRLIVPKFRDMEGHWAKDPIERLYSLDILQEPSPFFAPNLPASRYEFILAIMRAADIRVETPKATNTRKKTTAPPIFKDLDPKDPNSQSIENAYKKGIVFGVSPDEFGPQQPLTRVQAMAIMIRALGLEHRAPTPGYRTSYADHADIPYWGLDSVYMASEIGLVKGDARNRVLPNQPMTRAELAAMLSRFLQYLENDLQKDYREDILYFF